MSLFDLERAIRSGVSRGVGRAIGDAIGRAVEPAATDLANRAAGHIDNAAGNAQAENKAPGGFEGAMASLKKSVEGYATEAAKNIKICPNCDKPATADKRFCPECGTELPQQTVAEGAVCTGCGKQNSVGMKFCSDCGAKLPFAVMEERAETEKNAAVMAQWDEKLSSYPKWSCGGANFSIEQIDDSYTMFCADFKGDPNAAYTAVKQYQNLLMQNGFKQAGQYPSIDHLYKKTDGICYHVDTEHAFDGDGDCPTIYFNVGEPTGGYDYTKPEPRQGFGGLKDLFNF